MQAALHTQSRDQVHGGKQHDLGQPQPVADRVTDRGDGSRGGYSDQEIREPRGKNIPFGLLTRFVATGRDRMSHAAHSWAAVESIWTERNSFPKNIRRVSCRRTFPLVVLGT